MAGSGKGDWSELRIFETNFRGRFDGLAKGWLDAAVGPLTITAEREEICDFTHAYFISSLGAAILKSGAAGNENLIFNPAFLRFVWSVGKVALALLAAMAAVTILIWLCERGANPAQFSGQGHPVRGLGASLWWAAVTMASVGYGDLASPAYPPGPNHCRSLDVRQFGLGFRFYRNHGIHINR